MTETAAIVAPPLESAIEYSGTCKACGKPLRKKRYAGRPTQTCSEPCARDAAPPSGVRARRTKAKNKGPKQPPKPPPPNPFSRTDVSPRALKTLHDLDPGHEREHMSILRNLGRTENQLAFARELLVMAIFARSARKPWALRAHAVVAGWGAAGA